MRRLRFQNDVVIWAPAKVNLFLEVLGKRPDGYHELATLMVAIRLFDRLILRLANDGELTLHCQRPELSTGPDNLVLRAARLLQERSGCRRGARIELLKRIPLAAGLAGGSTDAAAALWGLNELWELGLGKDELAGLGAELGSDVPFFFHTPAAWCTGRGEVVEPLSLGAALDLVLVCPPFGMATADVYRQVRVPAAPETGVGLIDALAAGDPEALGVRLFNRLEEAAGSLNVELGRTKARLVALAPAGALMSGSGSTLFALARNRVEAKRLAAELRGQPGAEKDKIFLVRSCV